jgi:hypothetical protein
MKRREVAWILLEEAIRAMALFGMLVFGVVVHVVRLFDMPAGPALLGAFSTALLGFVVLVAARLETGREFKVRSRRGAVAVGVVAVVAMGLIEAVRLLTSPEASWRWWRIVGAILIAVLFTWFNARLASRHN